MIESCGTNSGLNGPQRAWRCPSNQPTGWPFTTKPVPSENGVAETNRSNPMWVRRHRRSARPAPIGKKQQNKKNTNNGSEPGGRGDRKSLRVVVARKERALRRPLGLSCREMMPGSVKNSLAAPVLDGRASGRRGFRPHQPAGHLVQQAWPPKALPRSSLKLGAVLPGRAARSRSRPDDPGAGGRSGSRTRHALRF